MKELLKKEICLTASPLSYFFLAFSFMALIPNYPILVGSFFVCLGIFYSFQFAREYNDILFTALLPVAKRDVVRAKYGFCLGIQLLSLLLSALCCLLRMTLWQKAAAYAGNTLMQANLAYLGYALLLFALFNLIFLGGFFKTAYYIGKPFVYFCVAAFLLIAVAETLHHLPGLSALNSLDSQNVAPQLAVLLIGLLFYVLISLLSCKSAQNRFQQIDL